MQTRPSQEVFKNVLAYCPPSLFVDGEDPTVLLAPLFDGASTPEEYFRSQSLEQQNKIKDSAEKLRVHLLDTLQQKTDPSPEYTDIYNALLLLAYYFPLNQLSKKNEVICPMSGAALDKGNCFVAADGVWFLARGSDKSILAQANNIEKYVNPITKKPLIGHDVERIKKGGDPDSFAFMAEKWGTGFGFGGSALIVAMVMAFTGFFATPFVVVSIVLGVLVGSVAFGVTAAAIGTSVRSLDKTDEIVVNLRAQPKMVSSKSQPSIGKKTSATKQRDQDQPVGPDLLELQAYKEQPEGPKVEQPQHSNLKWQEKDPPRFLGKREAASNDSTPHADLGPSSTAKPKGRGG